MNQFFGGHRQAMGGYQALVRLPRDGFPKPILNKRGTPIIFKDPLSAQIAATDAICAFLNGKYRRDGETLSGKRCEAEKVFAKLGGGRRFG